MHYDCQKLPIKCDKITAMFNAIRFIYEWIRVIIKIARPGGVKIVAAENMALRQELITISRKHRRSPKLKTSDRLIYGFLCHWISKKRLSKIAILINPATILKFHQALVKRKYHLLFSNKTLKKPGRKGPSDKLIQLIVVMKTRSPRYGYLRIAMQIQHAFGFEIDKGVGKRVLDKHYHPPETVHNGPSWLTFIGHTKDSLWSLDFFRCESIFLKSHWVIIIMDQFTRQIIGFSVHVGDLNGVIICRMFNKIILGKKLPKYLSTDNDPLFKFHRWKANLRILNVEEIKTVPYTPESHPFIERLIGTVRREYLDQLFFWNKNDLSNKLLDFQHYYNDKRAHSSLEYDVPAAHVDEPSAKVISMNPYRWKSYARNLFQLPITG